jgi:hypothetical protein
MVAVGILKRARCHFCFHISDEFFWLLLAPKLKIGQVAGLCSRTVSFTGKDASNYNTHLIPSMRRKNELDGTFLRNQ